MPDFIFPFPNRELALQELRRDPCYSRIPLSEQPKLIQHAWEKGEQAARNVWEESGKETDFFTIAKQRGLAFRFVDIDQVVGTRRYFSDYLSGQNQITFYKKSIALWAAENHLTQDCANNLILSHEFFHYLEWNQLGLASRLYEVPMVKIGPLKIGRTGIRALSEIGAHAFARTYYELARKKDLE